MARVFAINENHSCDYGIDFINGVAVVPDADTTTLTMLEHQGYTVETGLDAYLPWDFLTTEQLALFAPYAGINPTGLSKYELVTAITTQLALMKIEITSFDAIDDVAVGTEGEAIYANANAVIAALPTTVYCDAGTVAVPVTTWVETDTYDPDTAGSYTFTATLGTLPLPYANTAGATATVEVVVSDDVEITSFDAIDDVAAGTEGEAIYANATAVIAVLPTTVLGNNGTVAVPVTTWVETDTYDPDTAGSYTFTATLGTLPDGYANTGDFTATVEVVVAEDVEITDFVAIDNVDGGTVGEPTYIDASAVIAALPTTVTANVTGGGTIEVPVTTWVETDTYNAAVAASYTFTATLGDIPDGYANTGDFTATVEVVVGE